MFRNFFVSTLMVSTSFAAFAMNNGQVPQTPEEIRKARLAAIPPADARPVVVTNSPIRTITLNKNTHQMSDLPTSKSMPDLLKAEVDFLSVQSKTASDAAEKIAHTRSLSSSSSSSSSSSGLSSSSSSSNNLPQVFLASHATCALATTSTSLSALAEEESVSSTTSSSEKRLAFKSAIKALPRHLRTGSLKSEYKELRKRFRTAAFIQSLAWFPVDNVQELKEFLWGLPQLPEGIDANNLVTLITTVRSLFPRTQDQVRCLNQSLDLLIEGKGMRYVETALRQKATM